MIRWIGTVFWLASLSLGYFGDRRDCSPTGTDRYQDAVATSDRRGSAYHALLEQQAHPRGRMPSSARAGRLACPVGATKTRADGCESWKLGTTSTADRHCGLTLDRLLFRSWILWPSVIQLAPPPESAPSYSERVYCPQRSSWPGMLVPHLPRWQSVCYVVGALARY